MPTVHMKFADQQLRRALKNPQDIDPLVVDECLDTIAAAEPLPAHARQSPPLEKKVTPARLDDADHGWALTKATDRRVKSSFQVLGQLAPAQHAAQEQAQAFAPEGVFEPGADHEFAQVSRAGRLQLALAILMYLSPVMWMGFLFAGLLRTMATAERCDPMWLAVAADEIERLIERVDELTAAGDALAE
ncbi:MAG: hypothetical protein ACO3P1_10100, partial [Pseudomonadales bacterium]